MSTEGHILSAGAPNNSHIFSKIKQFIGMRSLKGTRSDYLSNFRSSKTAGKSLTELSRIQSNFPQN